MDKNRIYCGDILATYFCYGNMLKINQYHLLQKLIVQPTIKVKAKWSKASINILDDTVSLTEGMIETELFFKPTYNNQYLQSSSCDPFHCRKGYTI